MEKKGSGDKYKNEIINPGKKSIKDYWREAYPDRYFRKRQKEKSGQDGW